jgi:anti-sigma28 factor (negative regulator of flagellin synthesis)
MNTIKNPLGPVMDERASQGTAGGRTEPVKKTSSVTFERQTSASRRLYEQTRLKVESESSERMAEIKLAVKNGTWTPNLQLVAERLASELIPRGD